MTVSISGADHLPGVTGIPQAEGLPHFVLHYIILDKVAVCCQ